MHVPSFNSIFINEKDQIIGTDTNFDGEVGVERMPANETICPFCGNSIPKDTINCSLCGAKISDPDRYQTSNPVEPKPVSFPVTPVAPVSPGSSDQKPVVTPRTQKSKRKLYGSGCCLFFMLLGTIPQFIVLSPPIEVIVMGIVMVALPGIVFVHHLFFPPRVGQVPQLASGTNNPRYIPAEVRRQVWARDGGRCVQCGDNRALQYDHIIPFSKGGANTIENLQLLCANCNSLKRDRIDG